MRGREGGARTGNATTSQHDQRMRGRCNERMTRDDGATTSWRNETTRGGTTRQQDGERVARREAMQQPAGTARGREGGAGCNERTRRGDATTSWRHKLTREWRNERTRRGNATTSWRDKTTRGQRNERTARGDATTSWCDKTTRRRHNERTARSDATTSWHDKMTPGQHDERRHNLVVFRVQTVSTGEVAAMVMLVLSVNQNDWALENGVRALSHCKDMWTKMTNPFVRVSRGPT